MANVFIVEDQEDSFRLLRSGIDAVHQVMWAKSLADAKVLFLESNFDLAIVDVGLPDGDGFEFCSWVRQKSDYNGVPIIFVSANQSLESKVTGLMIGGDDYISKPFHMAELRARIESKLRYRNAQKRSSELIKAFGIEMNLKSRQVTIEENGSQQNICLTPIEFKILHYLMEESGEVCDRDNILNRVWGKDIYVFPRSVDTHVSKLRKKLGSKSDLITCVHGSGYRIGNLD